jgi:hypothetical protein
LPFGYPWLEESLVHAHFVCRYLIRIDLLFMQEMRYWFDAATVTLATDIDAFVSDPEVTVSLGQGLKTVPMQNGADSRRVAFIHLINPKNERKIDSLFNSNTAEQRVLGTARSPLFS